MLLQLIPLLAAATIEVTTHGAVANDGNSDSVAFRAAFAAASAGDTVHAGAGTWDLPRIDNLSAVYLTGVSNITFDGEGATTILKMAGGTHVGDYNIFNIESSSLITLTDFACDGNRSNIVSADEQTHCIRVNEVAGFTAHDLVLSHAYGDGIKFIGNSTTMTDVLVYDVTMDDNGRSGLAFAGCGDCLLVRITATNISDQGIDTEPPIADQIDGFTILDSYIGEPTSAGAAALTLSNGTDFNVYDTIVDGPVHSSGGSFIYMDHVTIRATNGANAVTMNEATDVTMVRVAIEARDAYSGISTASVGTSTKPTRWTLTDVKITVDSGRAFSLDGGGPGVITITRPRIRSSHPSRYAGIGLYASSTLVTPAMTGIVFDDVDITGMGTGITISQGSGKAAMSAIADGTITLAYSGSTGTLCADNGGVTFDRSGLTITATTANNGCP